MKAGVIRSRRNQAGQEQDHQRLEGPQQDVQAGRDRGQPDQAQRVRQTRVEETEPTEQRRALGPERDPLAAHQDGEDGEARRELDRQQRERRDLVEGGLADDRPDTPAGGGQDQRSEVTRGDRRTRHGGASRGDDGKLRRPCFPQHCRSGIVCCILGTATPASAASRRRSSSRRSRTRPSARHRPGPSTIDDLVAEPAEPRLGGLGQEDQARRLRAPGRGPRPHATRLVPVPLTASIGRDGDRAEEGAPS